MLGGMNPGQMKKLMQQMGIKNTEVNATRVIVKRPEGDLVVENPQVVIIEMGGQKSLQVMGEMREEKPGEGEKEEKENGEKEKSDVGIVMEKAHCSRGEAEKALEKANGDIVEAIMLLENRE